MKRPRLSGFEVARIVILSSVSQALVSTPVWAQTFDLLAADLSSWVIVTDDEAGGDRPRMTSEVDGLGILTGASSILYLPDVQVSGDYRLEVVFQLFDPMRRNEGFGLIFGGTDLSGFSPAYTYFLIRQDGYSLVKQRLGDRVSLLSGWSESSAIQKWAERKQGSDHVLNRVTLEVATDGVQIFVNGFKLQALARDEVATSGLIGLRLNHGLRVLVEKFVVEVR